MAGWRRSEYPVNMYLRHIELDRLFAGAQVRQPGACMAWRAALLAARPLRRGVLARPALHRPTPFALAPVHAQLQIAELRLRQLQLAAQRRFALRGLIMLSAQQGLQPLIAAHGALVQRTSSCAPASPVRCAPAWSARPIARRTASASHHPQMRSRRLRLPLHSSGVQSSEKRPMCPALRLAPDGITECLRDVTDSGHRFADIRSQIEP